jgi:hypothetical protein
MLNSNDLAEIKETVEGGAFIPYHIPKIEKCYNDIVAHQYDIDKEKLRQVVEEYKVLCEALYVVSKGITVE